MTTETVLLAQEGPRFFDAYLSSPVAGNAGRKPAILILSEMFGINGPMRALADGWAARGHAAMVPNVFWRSQVTSTQGYDNPERQVAFDRLKTFDFQQIPLDLKLAVARLRAAPACSGKVVAVGFCAGGTLAWLAAARSDVDAAAAFYALGIGDFLADAPSIRVPVQLHYGRNDPHVPMAEIDKVLGATKGHASVVPHLYEAGHSFFNSVRPTYDAAAAKLAGERVDALVASL